MNYEVWLHARDPKTLELVATLRVFTHPDRLAAEGALENAEALFTNGGRAPWGIPSGSLVTTHMRRQLASGTQSFLPEPTRPAPKAEAYASTWRQLIDALVAALPFVEDAEKSDHFKPGYVKGRVAMVRAALKQAGAL